MLVARRPLWNGRGLRFCRREEEPVRRAWIPLLLVCLCVGSAAGEDATPTATDPVAEAVKTLLATKDEAVAARIAAEEHPDPWLVFDALVAGGHVDQARWLAAAAKGLHVERIREYARRHRSLEAEPTAARALDAALAAATPAKALRALPDIDEKPITILRIRIESERGTRLRDSGKMREASEGFDRAAQGARRIGWRHAASRAYYTGGSVLFRMAAYREALKRFEKRLAIERSLDSKMGQGRTHFGIALCFSVLGKPDQAAEHLDKAETLAAASGDRYYLAKVHGERALAGARSIDCSASLKAYRAMADSLKQTNAEDYPHRFRPEPIRVLRSLIGALVNCASMSAKTKDDEGADAFGREALSAARATKNRRLIDSTAADVARLDGARHSAASRLLEALASYRRAAQLYERTGARSDHADVLRRMSRVTGTLGDHPRSLEYATKAEATLREIGERRELCRALRDKATALRNLVRYDESEREIKTALQIAEELREPQLQIDCLLEWARLLTWRAQYSRALDLRHRALRIHEAHRAQTDATWILSSLAGTMLRMGDAEKALKLLEQARRTAEAQGTVFDANSLERTRADCLMDLGEWKEALAIYEALTPIYERQGDRAALAGVLMQLAAIYRWQGRHDETIRCLDRATGLYVAIGYPGAEVNARVAKANALVYAKGPEDALDSALHAYELAELYGRPGAIGLACACLARLHVRRKAFDEAMRYAREGCRVVGSFALDRAEHEQAVIRSDVLGSSHIWGLVAALAAKDVPAVFEFVERGRATALVATLGGREALRNARVSAELRSQEETARAATSLAYRQYDAARRRNAPMKELKSLREELQKARDRQWDVVMEVQRATREQADLAYPDIPELEDVQAALDPDTALVSYASTPTRLVALVVTSAGVRAVGLAKDEAADDILQYAVENRSDVRAQEAARDLLIKPLKLPQELRRLLIVPERQIAHLPLATLDETRTLSLVPSATAWLMLRETRRAPGSKVLAIGDPSYADRPPPSSTAAGVLRGDSLSPLPETRAEVEAIGDTKLLGKAASETGVRKALTETDHWRAIHLACHGLVDETLPTRSALALTHDAENDGFLHANEILAEVQFSSDLVVLSACETGRGRVFRGEGLIGLSRSFMLAGSPRVIASLWKVDDAATKALMTKFYELWHPRGEDKQPRGLPAAEALREAQRFVAGHEKWKDPHYWAAWVLWGLPD